MYVICKSINDPHILLTPPFVCSERRNAVSSQQRPNYFSLPPFFLCRNGCKFRGARRVLKDIPGCAISSWRKEEPTQPCIGLFAATFTSRIMSLGRGLLQQLSIPLSVPNSPKNLPLTRTLAVCGFGLPNWRHHFRLKAKPLSFFPQSRIQ